MGNHPSSRSPSTFPFASSRISSLNSIETLSGSLASTLPSSNVPLSSSSSTSSSSEPIHIKNRLEFTESTVSFRSKGSSSLLDRYKEDLAQRHEYTLSLLKQLGKITNPPHISKNEPSINHHPRTTVSSSQLSPEDDIDRVRTLLSDCLRQYERTHLAYTQQKRFAKKQARSVATIVPFQPSPSVAEKSFHELTVEYFLTMGKEGGIVYTLQTVVKYLSNIVMVRLCLLVFIRLLAMEDCFMNRKLFIVFSGVRKLDFILQTYTFTTDIVEKVTHLKYLSFRYEFKDSSLRTWLPWCLSGKLFYPFLISWYIYISVPRYMTLQDKEAKDTIRVAMWDDNTETEKVGLPVPIPDESVDKSLSVTETSPSDKPLSSVSPNTTPTDGTRTTSTTILSVLPTTPPIPMYMFAKIQEHLAILQQKQRQAQRMYRVDSKLRIEVIEGYGDPIPSSSSLSLSNPAGTSSSSSSSVTNRDSHTTNGKVSHHDGNDKNTESISVTETKEVTFAITPRPKDQRSHRSSSTRCIPPRRKSVPVPTIENTYTNNAQVEPDSDGVGPTHRTASTASRTSNSSHYLAYKSSSLDDTIPMQSMVPYYTRQRQRRNSSLSSSSTGTTVKQKPRGAEFELSSSSTQDWIIPHTVNKVRMYPAQRTPK